MAKRTGKPEHVADGKVMLVGLGNPGPKYAKTRHNIGFMVVDRLASRWGVDASRAKFKAHVGTGHGEGRPVVCLKPQTYMNLSGQSVSRALQFFSLTPSAVIVAHDDIDLPFGALRLKVGGGHGGHNGLRSLDKELGTKDYFRLRVGVGRPVHGDVADYVLKAFSASETAELDDVIYRCEDAVVALLRDGLREAQNRFHGDPRG